MTSAVRVMHIASSGNIDGGAEHSLIELVEREQSHGITPLVVVPQRGTLANLFADLGIQVTVIRYFQVVENSDQRFFRRRLTRIVKRSVNIIAEYRIRGVIKFYKPHVVHLNSSTIRTGAEAAIECKIPIVWHIREFNDYRNGRIFFDANFQHSLMSQSERIIAVSNTVAEEFQNFVSNSKIHVIYDAVEKPKKDVFVAGDKSRLTDPNLKIALVGTIIPSKGQLIALKALNSINNVTNNKHNLVLVGPVGNRKYLRLLEKYIADNSLSEQVDILGQVADVYRVLQDADILLVTSQSESFGRATVEGMLAGCLVVGADNTGTRELLGDGNGVLFDGSEENLVNSLLTVNSKREPSRKVALKGQCFAHGISDSNESITRITSVFREASNAR